MRAYMKVPVEAGTVIVAVSASVVPVTKQSWILISEKRLHYMVRI